MTDKDMDRQTNGRAETGIITQTEKEKDGPAETDKHAETLLL